MNLDQQTLNALQEGGWSPSRRINLSEFELLAKECGFLISDPIREFLGSFGNLHVMCRTVNKDNYFHFYPRRATEDIDLTWVHKTYSERLEGAKLFVVGQAYSNHMTLMMDQTGKVYGGFDDDLFMVGENGIAAVNNLCANAKFPTIE
jgi:hypothetical protein